MHAVPAEPHLPGGSHGDRAARKLICALLVDTQWRVSWINPWALSGPDNIVEEVLTAIGNGFPGKAGKKVKAALKDYRALAAPMLKFIPVPGDTAKALADFGLAKLDHESTLTEQHRHHPASMVLTPW